MFKVVDKPRWCLLKKFIKAKTKLLDSTMVSTHGPLHFNKPQTATTCSLMLPSTTTCFSIINPILGVNRTGAGPFRKPRWVCRRAEENEDSSYFQCSRLIGWAAATSGSTSRPAGWVASKTSSLNVPPHTLVSHTHLGSNKPLGYPNIITFKTRGVKSLSFKLLTSDPQVSIRKGHSSTIFTCCY